DTGFAKTFQLRAVDGFGIGFERDLATGRDGEPVAKGADDPRDVVRIEQRRRPAAKVDGVDGSVGSEPGRTDVPNERVDVTRLHRVVVQAPIEVAVIADRRAERDVDVRAERCGLITYRACHHSSLALSRP